MAKVVCVLYDDPVDGYPPEYARDSIPKIDHYPDGMTTPTPNKIDFKPGELLGSVSGELGLRKFLEDAGHTLIVTSDKDGPNSVLEKERPDAEGADADPEQDRLQAGRVAGQRVWRARASQILGGRRAHADRDLGQGRAQFGPREREA